MVTHDQNPSSFQQVVEGALIGRDVLYDTALNLSGITEMERILELMRSCDRSNARTLSFAMHNNSSQNSLKPAIRRPLSAYFTYDPNSGTLIVEWGRINGQGDAKLHYYLNQAVDYNVRHKRGMVVRSGHIARITGSDFSYALFDAIKGDEDLVLIPHSSILHPMASILEKNRYIVISSDGFVARPV